MSRLRIQNADSGIVFIGSSTLQRRPTFAEPLSAELLLSILRFYERRGDFLLHAFCIMPDHYHLVLEMRKVRLLSRILNNIHSAFVYNMAGKRKTNVRYWSRHTWDVWIRNEAMY